ncbi:MAG: hypothetical protein AAFO69_11795, partial [Bacteroidota bacterium]
MIQTARLLFLSLGLLCILQACSTAQSTTQTANPTRDELIQQFRTAGKVTIYYGQGSFEQAYRAQAQILEEELSKMYDVKLRPAPKQLDNPPEGLVFLVGSPSSNPLINQLSAVLSLNLTPQSVQVGNQKLSGNDVAFFTLLQNPQYPNTLYNLLTGPDDSTVLKWANEFFRRGPVTTSWDYQIYTNNQLHRYGFINNPDFQPSLDDLAKMRWSYGTRLIIYGTGTPEATDQYRAIAERMTRRRFRRSATVVADTAVAQKDLSLHKITLIGTVKSNQWLRKWRDKLPFRLAENKFTINDTDFAQKSDFIYISGLPNPENPYLPVSIIAAAFDESIVSLSERAVNLLLFGGGNPWNYQVYRGNGRIAMGALEMRQEKLWMAENRFSSLIQNADTIQTKNLRIINFNDTLNAAMMQQVVEQFEARQQKISAFLDRPINNDSITY